MASTPTSLNPDRWPVLNPAPASAQIGAHTLAAFLPQRLPRTGQRQQLLQALVKVQLHFGWISPAAIRLLGKRYLASAEEIRGLIAFYHFLHHRFQGEYRILLSSCVIDRFLGQDQVCDQLSARLGIAPGEMRDDGRVSLDFTSCNGLCDQGPAALVNGHPVTGLSPARAAAMAVLIEARRPLDQWPAHWFHVEPSIRLAGPLLTGTLPPGAVLAATATRTTRELLEQILRSGLRGRGGAGFPLYRKIQQVNAQPPGTRYLVCNADEGEPGTFKDRTLLQTQSEAVIEGMTLAARMLGAEQGFIYLRGEYAFLYPDLQRRLAERRSRGWLGQGVAGIKGFDFDIEIHLGAGAYICGEESALIESLEGRRGIPRVRPPYPVSRGYRGRPTLVNNVETFACLPQILLHGGDRFARQGTATSSGTKLHSISGDCARPGVYELPWGVTINELLRRCGGTDAQAVQVGGPSGTLVLADAFQRRLDFDELATGGALMVFGPQRDLLAVAHHFAEFFAHESCGFCTPCRSGTQQLRLLASRLLQRHGQESDLAKIHALGTLMGQTSHCGLGKTAAGPLRQLLWQQPERLRSHLAGTDRSGFNLAAALAPALTLKESADGL